jgi:Lipoprotein LpqB beta-propeller domain
MIRPARMGAIAVAVVFGLVGCTTVPDSSDPQIVQPVAIEPGNLPPPGPPKGAEPREIVEGFLAANGDTGPSRSSAAQYLTLEARAGWSDNNTTVTVVDRTQVGNVVHGKGHNGERTDKITVTGHQIGTIDDNGAYKPFLRGNGSGLGGVPLSQTYGLVRVKGQWRIDSLQPGLLVTAAQFEAFRQFAVYYFDSAEQDLVPEARYTQLSTPTDLIRWLVSNELAQQPPQPLTTAVPQAGSKQVSTTVPADPGAPNTPVTIEIPGASALDGTNLDRLAAQISATLKQVAQVDSIQITDGDTAVRIPAVESTIFTPEQLSGRYTPTPPGNQLYYVRGGAVYQESGRRIPGRVGAGAYDLTSAALTVTKASDALQVAGVRGSGSQAVLDISNPKVPGALVATTVHGNLSRPAWAPGTKEVWIGAGKALKRVTGPRSVQTVSLEVAQGKANGRVSAVRISPDGGRVALVLTAGDSSQIYVGNIVRNGNKVSVNNLAPITPQAVYITDVAWNDQLKLFVTGRDMFTDESQVYEVQCDGSIWNSRGNSGLPGAPVTVTAAAGSEAVVSTGNFIWQQSGTAWQGLLDGDTRGSNPIYLE